MKKWLLYLMSVTLWMGSAVFAEPPQALLRKADGRTFKVFLIKNEGEKLTIRLHKSKVNRSIDVATVDRLEIQNSEYDADSVQQSFSEANYSAVIEALESVVLPVSEYMAIPNNVQDACEQLMQAYVWNGDFEKAAMLADQLKTSSNPEQVVSALVVRALAALQRNDPATAEICRAELKDSAAELYVRANIERAQGDSQKAIQTVVDLIATHPNNQAWMPPAELLGAKLYLDLGLMDAAEATARQTQKMYAGTNIEKEAQAFRETLDLEN